MDLESILWRSPLVYKGGRPSPNLKCNATLSEGVLTATHLHVQQGTLTQHSVTLHQVLGAEILSATDWCLHTYPLKNGHYRYQALTFGCADAIACQTWVQAIRSALGQSKRRSLTILINPSSGRGQGMRIWSKIEPIFQQANCELQVYETQSADDLRQQVQNLALEQCSGLVILGGDGSMFHGVNGLMAHPDQTEALKLPLGFIPTGTSNGLVKSILDAEGVAYSAHNMAVAIAKGHVGALDLIQVQQPSHTYFSLLSLSWGFFSDVDIESDRMKGLGFLKNYLYTLLRLITYRTYLGQVELKIQGGWQALPGELITLWTMNVPWAAYNFKPAPKAKLNDAAFDVWITPKIISRWQFLRVLLKAFDGAHINMVGVNYYKAQALRISPKNKRGIFAIDGEPAPYAPIELTIFPDPLSIFVPAVAIEASALPV